MFPDQFHGLAGAIVHLYHTGIKARDGYFILLGIGNNFPVCIQQHEPVQSADPCGYIPVPAEVVYLYRSIRFILLYLKRYFTKIL